MAAWEQKLPLLILAASLLLGLRVQGRWWLLRFLWTMAITSTYTFLLFQAHLVSIAMVRTAIASDLHTFVPFVLFQSISIAIVSMRALPGIALTAGASRWRRHTRQLRRLGGLPAAHYLGVASDYQAARRPAVALPQPAAGPPHLPRRAPLATARDHADDPRALPGPNGGPRDLPHGPLDAAHPVGARVRAVRGRRVMPKDVTRCPPETFS